MSIFEDKKYEEMDWLAQAVEPIVSSLNDRLATYPAQFDFTYDDIVRLAFNGYSDLSVNVSSMVDHAFRKYLHIGAHTVEEEIISAYQLVLTKDARFDMVNGILHGTISLVKTKDHFEEKELLTMMGRAGNLKLSTLDVRSVDVARANEIIELIGGVDALLKTKSIGYKTQGIMNALSGIMSENKWNIRNIDLSNKIGLWIYLYLQHGNLAALTNFCKFKVMTHNGSPIYSVQEEPV